MVKDFLHRLPRWPAIRSVLAKITARFTTWSEDDYERSDIDSMEPAGPAPPASITPLNFEMRFMRLHAEERFEEMWDLLAEDAQHAWGGRELFVRDMPRLDDGVELLDMQVVSVNVIDGWTDEAHERTYSNVAQMVMRYRVRQQWREFTFDRQVHLVPAGGGWRTLCYPSRVRTAAGR
jgi:hypothetical protein